MSWAELRSGRSVKHQTAVQNPPPPTRTRRASSSQFHCGGRITDVTGASRNMSSLTEVLPRHRRRGHVSIIRLGAGASRPLTHSSSVLFSGPAQLGAHHLSASMHGTQVLRFQVRHSRGVHRLRPSLGWGWFFPGEYPRGGVPHTWAMSLAGGGPVDPNLRLRREGFSRTPRQPNSGAASPLLAYQTPSAEVILVPDCSSAITFEAYLRIKPLLGPMDPAATQTLSMCLVRVVQHDLVLGHGTIGISPWLV